MKRLEGVRDISFDWYSFSQLTPSQVIDIFRVRQAVFVVEQEIEYVDPDYFDLEASHLLAMTRGDDRSELAGYLRVLPPGTKFEQEVTFGRVLTTSDFRGGGLGKLLIQEALEQIEMRFPNSPIRISAQSYLGSAEKFSGP